MTCSLPFHSPSSSLAKPRPRLPSGPVCRSPAEVTSAVLDDDLAVVDIPAQLPVLSASSGY
eukprot:977850-Pleurochrysis_carterae.AAC.1